MFYRALFILFKLFRSFKSINHFNFEIIHLVRTQIIPKN